MQQALCFERWLLWHKSQSEVLTQGWHGDDCHGNNVPCMFLYMIMFVSFCQGLTYHFYLGEYEP
jgi:hypothetical protein